MFSSKYTGNFTLDSNWEHRVICGASIRANALLELDLVFQKNTSI